MNHRYHPLPAFSPWITAASCLTACAVIGGSLGAWLWYHNQEKSLPTRLFGAGWSPAAAAAGDSSPQPPKAPPAQSARLSSPPRSKAAAQRPPAPTGFRELQLGMTRKEVRALAQWWGVHYQRSRGLTGNILVHQQYFSQFFAFPPLSAYRGLHCYSVVFTDGKELFPYPPPVDSQARLRTLFVEFEELPRQQLATFLPALEDKYGPPAHRAHTRDELRSIGLTTSEAVAAITDSLYPKNRLIIIWQWPQPDVTAIADITIRPDTFIPVLWFEEGVRERARAQQTREQKARRQREKELRQRGSAALSTLRQEAPEPASLPSPALIRCAGLEMRARSVVFAIGGFVHKGHPWPEMRDAVLKSLAQLPDGTPFQITTRYATGGAMGSGELLRASDQTRSQARQYLAQHFMGYSAPSLRRAARCSPDAIIMLTNARHLVAPDSFRQACKWVRGNTRVFVAFWQFPGDFDSFVTADPAPWRKIARDTGGDFVWVTPRSDRYFYGQGPRVAYEYGQRTGRIIYADSEEVLVLRDHSRREMTALTVSFRRGRNIPPYHQVQSLKVIQTIPRSSVPSYAQKYLPAGCFQD